MPDDEDKWHREIPKTCHRCNEVSGLWMDTDDGPLCYSCHAAGRMPARPLIVPAPTLGPQKLTPKYIGVYRPKGTHAWCITGTFRELADTPDAALEYVPDDAADVRVAEIMLPVYKPTQQEDDDED